MKESEWYPNNLGVFYCINKKNSKIVTIKFDTKKQAEEMAGHIWNSIYDGEFKYYKND